jgi:hypothetical protein
MVHLGVEGLMGVIRTWGCLNCSREFDSWEAAPSCPDCECVRVNWVPGGGHIAGVSRSGDAEFKALADIFKLDDLHSAKVGEAAKKINDPQPKYANSVFGTPHDFGGFVANINPNAGAQCLPVANRINFKATAEVGRSFGGGQLGLPTVQSATTIDSSHRPKS